MRDAISVLIGSAKGSQQSDPKDGGADKQMVEVLDNIPVRLNLKEVLGRLQVGRRTKYIGDSVRELVELAKPLARARAIYIVSYVNKKDGDDLEIDGVEFTSRVLRVNLDRTERVFPYIITCGREISEIAISPGDLVKSYCLDTIKDILLVSTLDYLKDYLREKYQTGQMSSMSPGSLEDWPITQQRELFSLFGKSEATIGLRLTQNCVIAPAKSISGILFPTEIRFESCQLCPRERCSGRRAPYDPTLTSKYGLKL
jgi:hypothetical protein